GDTEDRALLLGRLPVASGGARAARGGARRARDRAGDRGARGVHARAGGGGVVPRLPDDPRRRARRRPRRRPRAARARLPRLSSPRRPPVARPEPRATGGGPDMSLALDQRAPSFTLPGVDGRTHSLDDYASSDVLVLIQSCNHCPYVLAWQGRMV